jgi:hypothetical protein
MKLELILFIFVFVAVAISAILRLVKNRGFRGAMFGAPVRKQVSAIELDPRGGSRVTLRVHVLDPEDAGAGPHVGVEVVRSAFGSWEMKPIALSRTEAQRLGEQLALAARESVETPRTRR